MVCYKKITLLNKNSSWWKEKKYRKESAVSLANYRKEGWRFIKKEIIKKEPNNKETRSFCNYYLKKKTEV